MRINHLLPLTLLLTFPLSSSASGLPSREVRIVEERFEQLTCDEQARVLDIRDRLQDILSTDRSALGSEERKALRAEWRGLKEEMDALNRDGTTIYISTAGLILIILLLIILL